MMYDNYEEWADGRKTYKWGEIELYVYPHGGWVIKDDESVLADSVARLEDVIEKLKEIHEFVLTSDVCNSQEGA